MDASGIKKGTEFAVGDVNVYPHRGHDESRKKGELSFRDVVKEG